MPRRYKPKKGDIITVNFNPQSGHEQAGQRPALVVSVDQYNARSNLAVVCAITTSANPWSFKSEIPSGCTTTGFVICDQIKALDLSARNAEFVEKAPDELTEDVDAKITALLGL